MQNPKVVTRASFHTSECLQNISWVPQEVRDSKHAHWARMGFLISFSQKSAHHRFKIAQNVSESFYTLKNTDCNLPNLKQINKEVKQTDKGQIV